MSGCQMTWRALSTLVCWLTHALLQLIGILLQGVFAPRHSPSVSPSKLKPRQRAKPHQAARRSPAAEQRGPFVPGPAGQRRPRQSSAGAKPAAPNREASAPALPPKGHQPSSNGAGAASRTAGPSPPLPGTAKGGENAERSAAPEGYCPALQALRESEFAGRLSEKVYADYAGAPPYADSVLRRATEELLSTLHGNPHSAYGWAQHASEAAAERVRQLTLTMCRADPQQYECILTSGATGALKLVAEAFPWGPGSAFLYLRDNHNSVLGVRQLAARAGAGAAAVQVAQFGGGPAGGLVLRACSSDGLASIATTGSCGAADGSSGGDGGEEEGVPEHLFAFPLESNLWGVRYEERLVGAVQQGRFQIAPADQGAALAPAPCGRWRVLLDAAKGCGTAPPDLSRHPADFVALSFYKIFGYPTGVGALLVRRDALGCLAAGKAYFGGGTVAASLAEELFFRRRAGVAGLEDGTPPFLQLPAVLEGFAFVQRCGGFPAVAAHSAAVARHLAGSLRAARHPNGAPLCVLYGAWPGGQGLLPSFDAGAGSCSGAARSGAGWRERQSSEAECGQAPDPRAGESHPAQLAQHAQHAQPVSWEQPEATQGMQVQQGTARHKALHRTQVLRHSWRRGAGLAGSPGTPGSVSGSELSRAPTSQRGVEVAEPPPYQLAGPLDSSAPGAASATAAGAAPPNEPALQQPRRLSTGGVGRGLSRAGSAASEATLYFTPRSSSVSSSERGGAASGNALGEPEAAGPASVEPAALSPPALGGEEASQLSLAGVAGQGPVVAFNVLRADGSYVGYREVEKLGSLHGIFLRTGCMCNPGACAQALGLAPAEMKANYEAGHVCWDDHDVIAGKPTGLVRASFGYASTLADADAVVELLERYFIEGGEAAAGVSSSLHGPTPTPVAQPSRPGCMAAEAPAARWRDPPALDALSTPPPAPLPPWPGSSLWPSAPSLAARQGPPEQPQGSSKAAAAPADLLGPSREELHASADASGGGGSGGGGLEVESIFLYPIKSCRGMQAHAWPLGPSGLLYDRHWALVDGSGAALTLRRCPALATIQPSVDLEAGVLCVAADGVPDVLQLPLPTAGPELRGGAKAAAAPKGAGAPDGQQGALSIGVCSRTACAALQASPVEEGPAAVAAEAGPAPVRDEVAVSRWFERALGVPCRLVRQLPGAQPAKGQGGRGSGSGGSSGGNGIHGSSSSSSNSGGGGVSGSSTNAPDGSSEGAPRSFANEAQLLVVTSASLADLRARVAASQAGTPPNAPPCALQAPCRAPAGSAHDFARRFRPNLVVGGAGARPYCEDGWAALVVGGTELRSAGACPRCDMICMDPFTGRREGPEPLLTLAGFRRSRGGQQPQTQEGRSGAGSRGSGKICFGVLFNQGTSASLSLGSGAQESPPSASSPMPGLTGLAAESSAGSGLGREREGPQLAWVCERYRRYVAVGMAVQAH